MTTTTYLDGTQLTSTALTDDQINIVMQVATAQMLGIVLFARNFALAAGSNIATPHGMGNLATGQTLSGNGIADGATITGVDASTVTLSAPATQAGTQTLYVAQPDAYSRARVGWQQEGQPGWGISDDVAFVRCSTIDTDYSRMRDVTGVAGETQITQTDVFTRAWRVYWTFYGPHALDNARAVRSALIKIPFVSDLLAESNLYGDPDIAEPGRNPEQFQGQWWERTDLSAQFNEQITETFTVGSVASVEVSLSTRDGEFANFITEV